MKPLNVCVVGQGHFASIVAVCVAARGHYVLQSDETPPLLRASQIPPEREPGYPELASDMRCRGRLIQAPLPAAVDVYWIAYDVPLDALGAPDISEVARRIVVLDERVPKEIPFLVSCQWPVGTTAKLEAECHGRRFIYVLENVRAGKAMADFTDQRSIIIGARQPLSASPKSEALIHSVCDHVVVMSPESAEFSKHALNAFIALQIAFVNELARIAEAVDANMADVSRTLLSDPRVSPNAPLRSGAPFGGGSLQRDLMVLDKLAVEHDVVAPVIRNILPSNLYGVISQ